MCICIHRLWLGTHVFVHTWELKAIECERTELNDSRELALNLPGNAKEVFFLLRFDKWKKADWNNFRIVKMFTYIVSLNYFLHDVEENI